MTKLKDRLDIGDYEYTSIYYDHNSIIVRVYHTECPNILDFFIDEEGILSCYVSKDKEITFDTYWSKYRFEWAYNQSKKYEEWKEKGITYINLLEKEYILKVLSSPTKSYYDVFGSKIYLHLKNKKTLKKWIRQIKVDLVNDYVKKRVNYWAKKMNAKINGITYSEMTRCRAYFRPFDSTINFSYDSLGYTKYDFERLIVHEVTHYHIHDHRKDFWDLFEKYAEQIPEPNYKKK